MEIIEENKIQRETLTEEGNDAVENQEEGYLGDEGMNVNSDKNRASLMMDVDELFTGDNESEVNPCFEGNENAGEDPMDVCIPAEKEKNDKNRMDIFEFKDGEENVENSVGNGVELVQNAEKNKKIDENVENPEVNGDEFAEIDDDSGEDEAHNFVIGDFVWGKIKTHPWWPGQIYDPSDASHYANAMKRKGRLLVAYFGDGSFAWCSPSQLKPFIDNFQEMSDQSNSKKFVNAVKKAMEEVTRLVGAELICKCDSADYFEKYGVLNTINSGIKEGVPVPKGNTVKILMDRLQPVELVLILKDCARIEPGSRLFELELELTVLKSFLGAFYRRKGGYPLVEFHDSKCIEGLEDKSKGATVADSDVSGPSENGDDKLYQKRKKKSVAELLMGKDEPKIKKVAADRKRKPLVVSVSPESDHESGGSGGGGGGGVEEGTMSPRQRKKSKYLSPPYLSPVGNGKLSISGSGSFKEPKIESEKSRLRERSDSKEADKNRPIDHAADANHMLHGLLRAALDPTEKALPAITDFISLFRGSIFGDGKKNSPMTLVIEFPPEAAMPTKPELIKTYKKIGDMIKKETRIDGSSGYVVFGNGSDAEAALAMSLEEKPFGDNVEYRVCEEAVKKPNSRKVVAEETSGVESVLQKLETMSQMVQGCDERQMSVDVKASLERGFKEVIEKVGNMRAE